VWSAPATRYKALLACLQRAAQPQVMVDPKGACGQAAHQGIQMFLGGLERKQVLRHVSA